MILREAQNSLGAAGDSTQRGRLVLSCVKSSILNGKPPSPEKVVCRLEKGGLPFKVLGVALKVMLDLDHPSGARTDRVSGLD